MRKRSNKAKWIKPQQNETARKTSVAIGIKKKMTEQSETKRGRKEQ